MLFEGGDTFNSTVSTAVCIGVASAIRSVLLQGRCVTTPLDARNGYVRQSSALGRASSALVIANNRFTAKVVVSKISLASQIYSMLFARTCKLAAYSGHFSVP